MPLPSSRLQVPSRAPSLPSVRDRERAGSVRDRLGERERIHLRLYGRNLHSQDDRGRVRGGDWAKERDRGDREQARESEKQREQRALVRAREADRKPGEITSSDRMEDGELDSRDSRGPATHSARQGAMDSGEGTSPPKKRKFDPIVWDLDDTKRGTQQALTLPAPHISTRM